MVLGSLCASDDKHTHTQRGREREREKGGGLGNQVRNPKKEDPKKVRTRTKVGGGRLFLFVSSGVQNIVILVISFLK